MDGQLKVIALHIPRTAGTSLRLLLRKNFGPDMNWWDIDNTQMPRPDAKAIRTSIIGGHEPFGYYRQLASSALMISALREPVSRALSFWHYITSIADRSVRDHWKALGVDPRSLSASIDNVPELRAQVFGQQCFYLTGFREYAKAKQVIESGCYMVGVVARLPLFVDAIADTLGLRFRRLPITNEGFSEVKYSVRDDSRERTVLKQLTREDQMLYADVESAGIYASNQVRTLKPWDLPKPMDVFREYIVNGESLDDAAFVEYVHKEILGTQVSPRVAAAWKGKLQAGKVERRDICAEAFEIEKVWGSTP